MREVTDLRQFSERLAHSTDMAVVCEAGAEALLAATGGESARVAVLDSAGAFIVWATAGAPSDWLGEARIVADAGLAGRAAGERRLLVLQACRVLDESGESVGQQEPATDLTSIAVPLVVEDRVLGVAQVMGALTDASTTATAATICGLMSVAVDRARLYEQARFEHAMDRVTGLWRYADFRQRLLEEMERAQRYQTSLSLLRIDVDGFQAINKQSGHRAADNVLADLATIVCASLRATDVAARIGPDEIALILPETGSEGARTAAEHVRKSVEGHSFSAGDQMVPVTVSCGVTPIKRDDSDEDALAAAERALAQSRAAGGNTVTVAGE